MSDVPELDFVSVSGFKSLASVPELKLAPINVVIGANGAGKSNLVQVFALLQALRDGRLGAFVLNAGGADNLLHLGRKVTSEISIAVSFCGGRNRYSITLVPNELDELVPADEHAYFWDKQNYDRPYERTLTTAGKEAGISKVDMHTASVEAWVAYRLSRWRVYHFHDTSQSSPMKKTADVHDNAFLRPDGSNLAAFLYLLKVRYPTEFSLISAAVGRVAPFFEEFTLEPSGLDETKIRLQWRHKGSDKYFDASSFSDGTLRFVALATLFLQPSQFRPSVVLVDEPELGLHPYAITILASLVRTTSVEETQVILSTQSPILLDNFDPEEVLVADRAEASTTFTRLERERLRDWLKEYSLGQLWEKNELGGRPGSQSHG